MKKACLVVSDYLKANEIFNPSNKRDNIFDRFIKLREGFLKKGYDLSTDDINTISSSDIVLYASNMPDSLPLDKDKSHIILSESAFICPENFKKENHLFFNKIFTWSDDLVDGDKYIKLNYSHSFPSSINKNIHDKKKLCTLVAGNKKPPYTNKGDLYFEREKAIRWFEKNYPNDFDLYGVGWDKKKFYGSKLFRGLNRIPFLPYFYMKLTFSSYPSYKGVIAHKIPVMEQYKFSICYENAKDISGYITEKIFDSFFSGCVPIYWGADNILDYIPKECFIDRRDFSSYEELYSFLINMNDSEYLEYLKNIEDYLNSERSNSFKSEFFSKTIIDSIF